GAHQLHGLTRPAERARHVVVVGDGQVALRKHLLHHRAAARRLAPAERIERNVVLALQPALAIPVRLAMTDEIENGLRHGYRGYFFDTVLSMSRGGGWFM